MVAEVGFFGADNFEVLGFDGLVEGVPLVRAEGFLSRRDVTEPNFEEEFYAVYLFNLVIRVEAVEDILLC